MERENLINVFVAARRAGKSTTIAEYIIKDALLKGKEVIICQPKENDAYLQFKDNPKVKIYITSSLDLVMMRIRNAYNACIIIEESRVYFKRTLPDHIVTAIINTGQQNTDIHFVCHNFTWTCKDFFRIADTFTIMAVKESPEARAGEFSEDEIEFIKTNLATLKKYDHFVLVR